jgi:hypothetical protein
MNGFNLKLELAWGLATVPWIALANATHSMARKYFTAFGFG